MLSEVKKKDTTLIFINISPEMLRFAFALVLAFVWITLLILYYSNSDSNIYKGHHYISNFVNKLLFTPI